MCARNGTATRTRPRGLIDKTSLNQNIVGSSPIGVVVFDKLKGL